MGDVVQAKFGKRGALKFGMTARQRTALAFIWSRIEATGSWPTMEAIKGHLGLASTMGTIMVIQRLADLGEVTIPNKWPGCPHHEGRET